MSVIPDKSYYFVYKTNSEELYMIKFRWAFAKVTSHYQLITSNSYALRKCI